PRTPVRTVGLALGRGRAPGDARRRPAGDARRRPLGGAGCGALRSQPRDRRGDALGHVDPGLPAEQLAGLLDRGPAALNVDVEAREALELELLRVLPARLPNDLRDLRDGQLARGGDVEVLVLARARAQCRDDALGDVVDVREGARLFARAEDLQRALTGEHLVDQVGNRVREPRFGVR